MEALEKQNLICKKLIDDGWRIDSCSYTGRCEIIAHKRYAEISITTEECLCHGGRLWIHDRHTNNYYELTHESYDESLGIVDSDTELRYIIENEMMDYVNRYGNFIYKLVKINEFGQSNGIDKEDVTYFANMKSIANRISGNQCDDIYLIEEVKVTYPNKNVYDLVKRISKKAEYSWEKDRIWFLEERYDREDRYDEFKLRSSYEMYVDIFNKG